MEADNDNEEHISIDACATFLATLDERAYHRSLMRDADNIAQGILLPMDLPWMHAVVPVARNIPVDIDNLTATLTADDGLYSPFENGPFGYGKFDIGQLRRGTSNSRLANAQEMVCSASRRSDEPGVIELSKITLPPLPQDDEASASIVAKPPDHLRENSTEVSIQHQGPDDDERGELSLRCFELMQKRRRRKVNQSRSCVQKQFISVKVNGSSSRASLFSNSSSDNASFFEATLPLEVQNGRFLSVSKAQSIANKLGTFNWRHGLAATNHSGKNSNRISAGRTRLMWTEKSPADQPQRVYFTSLLTGAKLDSGAQKRPREIRVGIKVNGELWKGESKAENVNSNSDLIHTQQKASKSSLLCTLDSDRLVQSILKGSRAFKTDRYKDKSREPELGLLSKTMFIKPARIECVPDCNGIISVLCSSPGSIETASIHEPLNNAARQHSVCSVCWSPTEDGVRDVKECYECGVSVHLQCCRDTGIKTPIDDTSGMETTNQWRCAVCCKFRVNKQGEGFDSLSVSENSKKPRRKSRPPTWMKDAHIEPKAKKRSDSSPDSLVVDEVKCIRCPYSGGAMSPAEEDGNLVWIHEVCRIWVADASTIDQISDLPRCALCGTEDTRAPSAAKRSASSSDTRASQLIKCAAERCQVRFHPMCALLSSKLAEERCQPHKTTKKESVGENSAEKAKDEDSKLCTKFTLTALHCKAEEGAIGKDPGEIRSVTVPVGFCGIHNPLREPSFYGVYPGGTYLDPETMVVPSVNKSNDS